MSSILEIEKAIEKLPAPMLDELAGWLETLRTKRSTVPSVESWLEQARGVALLGVKTNDVMGLTRGEE